MLVRHAGNQTVNGLIVVNVVSLLVLVTVLASLHWPASPALVRAGAVLSILWVFYGVGIVVALFGFTESIREPQTIAMIAAGILAIFTLPGSVWFMFLRAQSLPAISSRDARQ